MGLAYVASNLVDILQLLATLLSVVDAFVAEFSHLAWDIVRIDLLADAMILFEVE